MLQRRESPDGVVWYESPLLRDLGVRHAFSTRIGGVSGGIFASLNLGNPSGCPEQDPRANILENERRLLDAAGIGRETLICRVHQVHGPEVALVRPGEPHDPHRKADAIVSDDPARVVSVRVADCVPVLIAGAHGRIVAAVHAGWRGVAAGVVPAAAATMRALGASALCAAIGPSIGIDAFEVGPEVVEALAASLGERSREFTRRGRDDRWHVDLRGAIALQLANAGCDRIDTTDRCTYRDADEFFSHRRDQGATGRMAAIITPKELASTNPDLP